MPTSLIGSAISAVTSAANTVASAINAATTLTNTAKNVLNSTGFTPAAGNEQGGGELGLDGGGSTGYGGGAGGGGGGGGRVSNPLHDYALYNYIFSLSVLDDGSYNGAGYKGGNNGPYLAKSASLEPGNRVPTAAGVFDFFIEDVKISHIAGLDQGNGNTNATGINFKVIEPYSMGLFFQAIQTGARAKGHANYLDAPYLLTLEFTGHIDADAQMISVPNTTRHFPIKLRLLEMRVTAQGAEYDINAYPVNEQAFEQAKITLNTAVSLKGKDVREMLKTDPEKSLEVYLTKRSKEQKAAKLINEEDKFEIIFPEADDIASASMGFDLYKKNDPPFGEDDLVYENGIYKRGNLSIDPKVSEFRFAQGTDVINLINQVILMSDYGIKALNNISGDGFINWWRVEVDVEYISSDANLPKTGTKPKKYIYRIVKYRADSSHFLPPNSRRKGTEADKGAVAKEYNYIYTGKNIDVLDFDINFKAGFYTTIHADGNQSNSEKGLNIADSAGVQANKRNTDRTNVQATDGGSQTGPVPTSQTVSGITTRTSKAGGGSYEDEASLAARQFHDAISAGVDMVNLNMTILGDPYYLSDTGMGNYHAGGGGYINGDGAMPWDKGEIHVVVNFKTPADFDTDTGLYNFGSATTVDQFSGLYRVLKGDSNFQKGKFTQTLTLVRLRNQDAPGGPGELAIKPQDTKTTEYGFDGMGGP
jgi:hypothetical protein